MMWGNGYGYGMAWWMWLVMGGGAIAFWVVVALVIRAILPGREHTSRLDAPEPMTLLKERLARGEVTPEEYEQRRRLLVDGH